MFYTAILRQEPSNWTDIIKSEIKIKYQCLVWQLDRCTTGESKINRCIKA
jgi:hypothetical protein